MIDCALYLIITGGGTGIIPALLERGGASSYFIGSYIPYAEFLTREIVKDEKIVSQTSAELLAAVAWTKVRQQKKNILTGLGSTSALAKQDEREDRVNETYLSLKIYNCETARSKIYSLHIQYTTSDRMKQEEWCKSFIQQVLSSITEDGKLHAPDFDGFDLKSITYL